MGTARLVVVLGIVFHAAGCKSRSSELYVELVSDVPLTDFDTIEVSAVRVSDGVVHEATPRSVDRTNDDYSSGTRVAAMELRSAVYSVRVRLLRNGDFVAQGSTQDQVRGRTGVRVIVPYACAGIMCEEGETCVSGSDGEPACSDERCSVTQPEYCDLQCDDEENPCEALAACAAPTCLEEGSCIYVMREPGTTDACDEDSYCDPVRGCIPRAWVPGVDAGIDDPDSTPSADTGMPVNDGICNIGTEYQTIDAAIEDEGCEEIVLPAGTYDNETQLFTNRAVTIRGAGTSTILHQNTPDEEQVLDSFLKSHAPLILEDLVVEGHSPLDSDSRPSEVTGPCIAAFHDLTLTRVIVRNCRTEGYGGGVYFNNDGDRVLTITDSTIENNVGEDGAGGMTADGYVSIDGSTIRNNYGGGITGGLRFMYVSATIRDTLIEDNESAGSGAGVSVFSGELFIEDSTIRDNRAGNGINPGSAAAIEFGARTADDVLTGYIPDANSTPDVYFPASPNLVIRRTSITGNESTPSSTFDAGGAIVTSTQTWMLIEDSLIADNAILNTGVGGTCRGGAINMYCRDPDQSGPIAATEGHSILQIVNSTLHGNAAGDVGGAIALGDGWEACAFESSFRNVTITGNTAPALYMSESAGTVTATVANTILYENGTDCLTAGMTITNYGYNVVGNDNSCFDSTSGNTSANPQLFALANNGGPTYTRLPTAGSSAINTGSCTIMSENAITADQRGTARPQGGTCDIGGVEVVP